MRTDNVVWEITHPQGFNLEITSNNFEHLLHNCVINHGNIKEKLIYIRSGNENFLTYIGSDRYNQSVRDPKYLPKISIKDVKSGDVVKLKSGDIAKYIGPVHVLKRPDDLHNMSVGRLADIKSTRVHIFQRERDELDNFILLGSPHIIHIETHSDIETVDIAQEFTKGYSTGNGWKLKTTSYNQPIIAYDNKPFSFSDMTQKLVEISKDQVSNVLGMGYNMFPIFVERDDAIGLFSLEKYIKCAVTHHNHIETYNKHSTGEFLCASYTGAYYKTAHYYERAIRDPYKNVIHIYTQTLVRK